MSSSNEQQTETQGPVSRDVDNLLSQEEQRKRRPTRPLMAKEKRKYMKKRAKEKMKTLMTSKRAYMATPARAYAFNFFLFSMLGSLLPFLPVFYGLMGFSSLENGILYAARPLISFWCGPLIASLATRTQYRSLILFLCVAGAVASTFSISVVRSKDGGILKTSSCKPQGDASLSQDFPVNFLLKQGNTDPQILASQKGLNFSSEITPDFTSKNKTFLNTWKTYISDTGRVFYHKLRKGIVLRNLFLYMLALTIASELFLSPTLHIAQASIKYNKSQSFFSNICLNRVFSKIGMMVSAITISFVAWKYKCIFYHVHYFYFHFYGFLAIGCITALASLLLPREVSSNNSYFNAMSTGCMYAFSSWSNAGYLFSLWVAGIAEGALNAYLLWFAASIGASEITIGMLVAVSMMTDLILHWSVGTSTKWIGHSGLLCIGVFLMSVQFFILSIVRNPLFLIPSQLLCGLGSSCIKGSLVSSAQANASKEIEKILCFVFQSVYLGLGLGLGGVFVSMPYYVFGPHRTFTALSIFTATYTVVHILIQCIAWKISQRRPKKGRYEKVATCDTTHNDWLVDALEEEELKDLKEGFIIVDESVESQVETEIKNNNEDINDQTDVP